MAGVTWTITGQTEEYARDPQDGEYKDGVRVRFTTGDGQRGSVFVPRTDYTEAVVRQRVADWASRMAGVADLVGGS